MNFTLPWPPSVLNPNVRKHWRKHAAAKKAYRAACAWTARSQGAEHMQSEKIALRIVFVPPCRRHRDLDNCVTAMKPGLDGLADALGVDDRCFTWSEPPVIADEIGGFVWVGVVPC